MDKIKADKKGIKIIRTLPNNKKTCIILRHHHWRKMVQALIKEQQKQR
jgi:hypothetical protein